jgi:2-polyprenyl-3-methyl-5-hydroxy-6-metoxy-1,4-benzoquinol methylase
VARDQQLSANSSFRTRRFARFVQSMQLLDAPARSVTILDMGGSINFWNALDGSIPDSVSKIQVVNLDQRHESRGIVSITHGDATNLSEFEDNSFDIVHSNSVIEHVGHWREMKAMAAEVHRLAPRHFVQTPNMWFPFEPHYRRPLYQFLPEDLRARLLMRGARGFMPQGKSYDESRATVESCNLLSHAQMATLFPSSEIYKERLFGLTKSFTAIQA